MKKELKHGENFAHDLLDWVNIKKSENEALYTELVDLFSGYLKENITKVYQKIMFMCDLPNGQLKGKLPQLYEIKKLLDTTRKSAPTKPKVYKDYAMICPYCGSAYPLDYYRCTEGFVITEDSSGNGFAKRCKDDKNENLGPLLVKQELVSFEKGLFLEQKC